MSTDPLPEGIDEYTDWFRRLPDEDVAEFCDLDAAAPLRWVEGIGWVEGEAASSLP